MDLDRRQAIKLIGAAALASGGGIVRRASAASDLPSLGDVAAERGLLYGATAEIDIRTAPPQYGELLARQCRLLAPVLAWSSSPRPGIYDFGRWENDVHFAQARGLKLTGSHLLWYAWIPGWFQAIPDRAAAERAVSDHVAALASRFAGQVYSWNVVNEAIEIPDGRPDGLRKDPLLEKLGPDYIDLGFRVAREADPGALLLYNDAKFEAATPEHEARRRALISLLDRLKRKNTPIDGVGLQCHVRLTDPFDERRYASFLREITDRQLKVVITELDVLDLGGPADIAARDRAVADLYARLLSVALENRAVVAVVTWGVSDRYSWLAQTVRQPFGSRGTRQLRPLPFDAEFQPKPAFYALLQAFQNAPSRSA
jgi:endo-1,4-beta-xylanase